MKVTFGLLIACLCCWMRAAVRGLRQHQLYPLRQHQLYPLTGRRHSAIDDPSSMENSSGLFHLPDVVAVWRKIENALLSRPLQDMIEEFTNVSSVALSGPLTADDEELQSSKHSLEELYEQSQLNRTAAGGAYWSFHDHDTSIH